MSDGIRTFIAVELSRATRQKLDKIKGVLRDCSLQVKWVEQYNFHITLKFLGDVKADRLEKVKDVLADILAEEESFPIEVEGVGAFPNSDYPKVVWAGVGKGRTPLTKLQQKIEDRMVEMGFEAERHSFTPHITLGRVDKHEKNLDPLSEKVKEFPFKINSPEVVDKITLMKSELTPQGPNYTPLAEFELN